MIKKLLKPISCSIAAVIAILLAQNSYDLRTTQKGLEIIGNAEGCRQTPYFCSAGVLTVGIGTATTSGEKIQADKIYTLEEIAAMWAKNIKEAENCVNRYANGRNLPQGTFEALTSLSFNVGCSKIKNSTAFKRAREGNIKAVCNEFSKWVYVNGKRSKGLANRREKEKALCLNY